MMSSFSQRRMTNSFSALFKLLPIDIRDFYEISLHSFSSLNLYIIFTFLSSSSTFLPQFFCLSSMGGSHIVWFITLLPCLLTRSRISLPVISCVLEALLPLLGGKWLKKKSYVIYLYFLFFKPVDSSWIIEATIPPCNMMLLQLQAGFYIVTLPNQSEFRIVLS